MSLSQFYYNASVQEYILRYTHQRITDAAEEITDIHTGRIKGKRDPGTGMNSSPFNNCDL